MDQKNIKYIYDKIIHWSDKTDTKANILLGFQLAIAGFFISRVDSVEFTCYKKLLLICCCLVTIVVIYKIFSVIWPRLSERGPKSIIYFRNIYNYYLRNGDKKTIESLFDMSDRAFKADLVFQIISLSEITTNKFKNLQMSILFCGLEIALILIILFF